MVCKGSSSGAQKEDFMTEDEKHRWLFLYLSLTDRQRREFHAAIPSLKSNRLKQIEPKQGCNHHATAGEERNHEDLEHTGGEGKCLEVEPENPQDSKLETPPVASDLDKDTFYPEAENGEEEPGNFTKNENTALQANDHEAASAVAQDHTPAAPSSPQGQKRPRTSQNAKSEFFEYNVNHLLDKKKNLNWEEINDVVSRSNYSHYITHQNYHQVLQALKRRFNVAHVKPIWNKAGVSIKLRMRVFIPPESLAEGRWDNIYNKSYDRKYSKRRGPESETTLISALQKREWREKLIKTRSLEIAFIVRDGGINSAYRLTLEVRNFLYSLMTDGPNYISSTLILNNRRVHASMLKFDSPQYFKSDDEVYLTNSLRMLKYVNILKDKLNQPSIIARNKKQPLPTASLNNFKVFAKKIRTRSRLAIQQERAALAREAQLAGRDRPDGKEKAEARSKKGWDLARLKSCIINTPPLPDYYTFKEADTSFNPLDSIVNSTQNINSFTASSDTTDDSTKANVYRKSTRIRAGDLDVPKEIDETHTDRQVHFNNSSTAKHVDQNDTHTQVDDGTTQNLARDVGASNDSFSQNLTNQPQEDEYRDFGDLREAQKFDVIIVGAGVGGLGAARYLAQRNAKVAVIEARNRIGGRMLTTFFPKVRVNSSGEVVRYTPGNPETKNCRTLPRVNIDLGPNYLHCNNLFFSSADLYNTTFNTSTNSNSRNGATFENGNKAPQTASAPKDETGVKVEEPVEESEEYEIYEDDDHQLSEVNGQNMLFNPYKDVRNKRGMEKSILGLAALLKPYVGDISGYSNWEPTLYTNWYNEATGKKINFVSIVKVNMFVDQLLLRTSNLFHEIDHSFFTNYNYTTLSCLSTIETPSPVSNTEGDSQMCDYDMAAITPDVPEVDQEASEPEYKCKKEAIPPLNGGPYIKLEHFDNASHNHTGVKSQSDQKNTSFSHPNEVNSNATEHNSQPNFVNNLNDRTAERDVKYTESEYNLDLDNTRNSEFNLEAEHTLGIEFKSETDNTPEYNLEATKPNQMNLTNADTTVHNSTHNLISDPECNLPNGENADAGLSGFSLVNVENPEAGPRKSTRAKKPSSFIVFNTKMNDESTFSNRTSWVRPTGCEYMNRFREENPDHFCPREGSYGGRENNLLSLWDIYMRIFLELQAELTASNCALNETEQRLLFVMLQSRLGYNSDLRETCISMCKLPQSFHSFYASLNSSEPAPEEAHHSGSGTDPVKQPSPGASDPILTEKNIAKYTKYVRRHYDKLTRLSTLNFDGKSDSDKLVINGWGWLLKHLIQDNKRNVYLNTRLTRVIIQDSQNTSDSSHRQPLTTSGGVSTPSRNDTHSVKDPEGTREEYSIKLLLKRSRGTHLSNRTSTRTKSLNPEPENIEVYCKYLLITIPNSLINDIAFEPRLDDNKAKSLSNYDMGFHNKVVMRFRPTDVFWPRNELQFNCLDESFQFLNLDAYGKTGCLLAHSFPPFSKNFAKLDKEVLLMKCLELLHNMFNPDRKVYPVQAFVTNWKSDPLSRGSYSYPTKFARDEDVIHLKSPHPISNPKVLFSGEYVSNSYYQCIDGSYDTSVRAAEDIYNLGLSARRSTLKHDDSNSPKTDARPPDTDMSESNRDTAKLNNETDSAPEVKSSELLKEFKKKPEINQAHPQTSADNAKYLDDILNNKYKDNFLGVPVPLPDEELFGFYLTDGSDELFSDDGDFIVLPNTIKKSRVKRRPSAPPKADHFELLERPKSKKSHSSKKRKLLNENYVRVTEEPNDTPNGEVNAVVEESSQEETQELELLCMVRNILGEDSLNTRDLVQAYLNFQSLLKELTAKGWLNKYIYYSNIVMTSLVTTTHAAVTGALQRGCKMGVRSHPNHVLDSRGSFNPEFFNSHGSNKVHSEPELDDGVRGLETDPENPLLARVNEDVLRELRNEDRNVDIRNQRFSKRMLRTASKLLGLKHDFLCYYCLRGGEVILCDTEGCDLVWHLECLPLRFRPNNFKLENLANKRATEGPETDSKFVSNKTVENSIKSTGDQAERRDLDSSLKGVPKPEGVNGDPQEASKLEAKVKQEENVNQIEKHNINAKEKGEASASWRCPKCCQFPIQVFSRFTFPSERRARLQPGRPIVLDQARILVASQGCNFSFVANLQENPTLDTLKF